MDKTLVEMAAEIVQAQAGQTRMTPEEIVDALRKAYEALKNLKAKEEEPGEEAAVEKKAVQGKASIQKGGVICLECGRKFRQLGKSHLSSHGLTAKEKGLGQKLAKARKKRAKG